MFSAGSLSERFGAHAKYFWTELLDKWIDLCHKQTTTVTEMMTQTARQHNLVTAALKKTWLGLPQAFKTYIQGTHRVRIHVVLLLTLTLTFDLSTQNHVTCRISKGHSLYQVWTLWDHSFLSYAADKQTDRQTDRRTLKSYPLRLLAWVTTNYVVAVRRL